MLQQNWKETETLLLMNILILFTVEALQAVSARNISNNYLLNSRAQILNCTDE